MYTNSLTNRIYRELERLIRDTPFTMTGWLLILTLLAVPLLLGSAYVGYQFNSELIRLQSRTNGMEHTTNYKLIHRGDNLEQTTTPKVPKERE